MLSVKRDAASIQWKLAVSKATPVNTIIPRVVCICEQQLHNFQHTCSNRISDVTWSVSF